MQDGNEDGDLDALLPPARAYTSRPFTLTSRAKERVHNVNADRLRVVYSHEFDRFFLQEEDATKTLTDTKTDAKTTVVMWDGLFIPPKSTTKANKRSTVVPWSDNAHSATDSATDTVEKKEHDTEPTIQEASPPDLVLGPDIEEITSNEAKLPPNLEQCQDKPDPHSLKMITTPQPAPISSLATEQTVNTKEGQSLEATQDQETSLVPDTANLLPEVTATPSFVSKPSKLIAAIRLVRSLRRFIKQRKAKRINQTKDAANTSPTVSGDEQSKPSKLIAAIRLLRSLGRFIKQRKMNKVPSTVPPTVSSASPPEASVLTETKILTEPSLSTSLQLDLSQLTQPTRVSPRKSPKKTRMPSYIHHFARASNHPVRTALQRQPQDEVRWQGGVLRVSVAVSKPVEDEERQPKARWPDNQHEEVALTHIFDLKQLQRIRPNSDGFRHVNGACSFTPLSSPSSSSSSDREQVAIVEPPREELDNDHDDVVYHRGDAVLFNARHRWFKGRILCRIKKSSFYDVKAANGTVFEAIPTQRLHRLLKEPHEKRVRHHYEKGDRVWWRPRQHEDDTQTYHARITRVRSFHEHFDLILRSGRVAKRVPYEELRPR
ncbi:hypothetical protein Poli38472_010086 [Pythium oligandrum]|uniref:Uncharacterized protein n=1 Tax=Pythium oligandrum TaxID=41045 RepID=A0A8K1C9R1_PYTOL|nr:hypothetical protein Poli38472_010086 [Pythium oligandrum]|eukprot:TMW58527.1 hypothetical protein Poli38472_010086 [Pythium oligandrum]